jgi:hypothetical protein
MLQQGQVLVKAADEGLTAADQCYTLAASSLARTGCAHLTSFPHAHLRQRLVEIRAITLMFGLTASTVLVRSLLTRPSLCTTRPRMEYNAVILRGFHAQGGAFPPRPVQDDPLGKECREMAITTDVVTVLHPAAEDVAEPQRLAPRLSGLQGTTVGLIDNHKRNANVYLEELGRLLQARYGVTEVVTYRKISQSMPTPDEVLDQLACTCDAIIHAVAD